MVVVQGDEKLQGGTSGRIIGFNDDGKAIVKAAEKVMIIIFPVVIFFVYFLHMKTTPSWTPCALVYFFD